MRILDRATLTDYRLRPHLVFDILLWSAAFLVLNVFTGVILIRTGSWQWLQRAGAPYVVIGTILFGRSAYRTKLRRHQLTEDPNEELDEAGTQELLQRRADQVVGVVGLTMSCVGSLIWAYADLLPRAWLSSLH